MAECALFCVAREILNLRKENWQSLPEPWVSADDVFMAKATITMDDLLAGDNAKQLVAGEMVTGHVLSVRKHEVLVDLGAQGIGTISPFSLVTMVESDLEVRSKRSTL